MTLAKIVGLAVVFVTFATIRLSGEEEPQRNPLEVLKLQFEELKADAYSAREKFDTRYVEELKKLEEQAQAKANLPLVLKVREEVENFRKKESDSALSEHPELARMQKVYAEHGARIAAEEQSKLATLKKGYRQQLIALIGEMTRANQIEVALKAREQLRIVESKVSGRFVRIDLPPQHEDARQNVISLAEVQVFSGGENIALAAKATQSSTDHGGDAHRAIDGNTSGHYDHGSATHTLETESPAWWELDLGDERGLERIVVWNRTDSNSWRLNGFTLSVLDGERRPQWKQTFPEAPKVDLTVDFEELPIPGKR